MSDVEQTQVIQPHTPVYTVNGGNPVASVPKPEPRRLRGLRMPVLPSLGFSAQVLGGGALGWGVYDRWGLSVLAILGGAAAVVLGALRESGRI